MEAYDIDPFWMDLQEIVEIVYYSGVCNELADLKCMQAFLKTRSYDAFAELVELHGACWNKQITLYEGYDLEAYGKEKIKQNYNIKDDDGLFDWIDCCGYAENLNIAEETDCGVIEIID